MHCQHKLCPVCLDVEVRRLTALLDAERSRCGGLERVLRHYERLMREGGVKVPEKKP